VDQVERERSDARVVAPYAGHVVRRHVSTGDVVAANQPAFELVDLARREIVVDIPGPYAGRVATAAALVVTLPERPDFRLETTLDVVVGAAQVPSRNFRGIARLEPTEDAHRVLKPGLFVRGTLHLEPLRGVLVVPADAVRRTNEGSVIVVADPAPPDSKLPTPFVARWLPVRTLGSDAGVVAVEPLDGTLAPGQKIVATGADLAFPGAPLFPREAGGGAAPAPGAEPASPATARTASETESP
jgi:multidrug efflux pump subunit AcrA (membrane-fusion protein)